MTDDPATIAEDLHAFADELHGNGLEEAAGKLDTLAERVATLDHTDTLALYGYALQQQSVASTQTEYQRAQGALQLAALARTDEPFVAEAAESYRDLARAHEDVDATLRDLQEDQQEDTTDG